MRKDTIWDRPSWPLKGKPSKIMDQINELLNNDNNFFEKDSYYYRFYINKLIDFCKTNDVLLLRTIGIIFTNENKNVSDYIR